MKMEPVFYQDFSGGVISNLPATKLGRTVSPRAWNSALRASKGGSMLVGKRPGFRKVALLEPPLTVVAQGFYHYTENNVSSVYHIGVASDGTLWELRLPETGGSQNIPLPVGPKEFASPVLEGVENGVLFIQGPQSQILVGLVRNGTPFKIYRVPGDTSLYAGTLGMPAPEPPTLRALLGSGNMYGILEVRATYLDANTGTESSASETLTIDLGGSTSSKFWAQVNLPLTSEAPLEATAICFYLRVPRLRTAFWRDASLQFDRDSTQWALGYADINYTDDQINGMKIKAPELHQNDQPQPGLLCGCWHLQRLFCSDGIRVFYSQPGNPEQFDGTHLEIVGPGGQLTLGLLSLNDQSLGVFKEKSIHELAGADPQVWDQNELVPDRGLISTLSLVKGDGKIGFWSEEGPCIWDQASQPMVLTNETLRPFADEGLIYLKRRDQTSAVFDPIEHRFLFKLDGATTWTIAPFSTVYGVWESLAWDLGLIGALAMGPSSAAENRVFFARGGLVYEMSSTYRTDASADEDGILWARVAAADALGVTLNGVGPFSKNPDESIARLIDAQTLEVHRSTYVLTGSTLVWDVPPPFIPTKGSPVVFDAPVMEWDTVDETNDSPSYEKRALNTYLEMRTGGDTPFSLGLVRDNEVNPIRVWESVIAANDKAALPWWPILGGTVKTFRRWAGIRYQWMRTRFVGWFPDCVWSLTMVGWQAVVQDDEK